MSIKRLFYIGITLALSILVIPFINNPIDKLTSDVTNEVITSLVSANVLSEEAGIVTLDNNIEVYLRENRTYLNENIGKLFIQIDRISSVDNESYEVTTVGAPGATSTKVFLTDSKTITFNNEVDAKASAFTGITVTTAGDNISLYLLDINTIPAQVTGVNAALLNLIPILFVIGTVFTIVLVTKEND